MVCAKSLEVFRTRGVLVRRGEERLVTDPGLDSSCLFRRGAAPSRQTPSDLGDDIALLVPILWPPHAQYLWPSPSGAPGVLNEVRPASCDSAAPENSAWPSNVIASGNNRVALGGGGGVVGCDGGDCEALSSCNRVTGDDTGRAVMGLSRDVEGNASVGPNEVPSVECPGFRPRGVTVAVLTSLMPVDCESNAGVETDDGDNQSKENEYEAKEGKEHNLRYVG